MGHGIRALRPTKPRRRWCVRRSGIPLTRAFVGSKPHRPPALPSTSFVGCTNRSPILGDGRLSQSLGYSRPDRRVARIDPALGELRSLRAPSSSSRHRTRTRRHPYPRVKRTVLSVCPAGFFVYHGLLHTKSRLTTAEWRISVRETRMQASESSLGGTTNLKCTAIPAEHKHIHSMTSDVGNDSWCITVLCVNATTVI
jgi:hypothetical protein